MCEVRRLFLQFDGRAHCRVAREGFNAPAATPVAPTRIFDLCLKDGKLYCKADYTRLFAEKCAFCAEAIAGVIPALHRHGDSFCLLTIQTLRCCGLAGGPAGARGEAMPRAQTFRAAGRACDFYSEWTMPPLQSGVRALGKSWHPDHFVCAACGTAFGGPNGVPIIARSFARVCGLAAGKNTSYVEKEGDALCKACYGFAHRQPA
jgi:hypothetical protein